MCWRSQRGFRLLGYHRHPDRLGNCIVGAQRKRREPALMARRPRHRRDNRPCHCRCPRRYRNIDNRQEDQELVHLAFVLAFSASHLMPPLRDLYPRVRPKEGEQDNKESGEEAACHFKDASCQQEQTRHHHRVGSDGQQRSSGANQAHQKSSEQCAESEEHQGRSHLAEAALCE